MASAGYVDRTLLASNYQDPGDVYDDSKTEGAIKVLADQNDANWDYLGTLVAGGTLQPYPAFLSRQALINGNFEIAQEGTSFSGNGIYTVDGWVMANGGGTATVTQQDVTPGDGFTPYKHFLRFSQSVAGTSNPNLLQRIESVYTFAGQSVSVLFKARLVSGGPYDVDVYMAQNFGTGGSPSAEVLTKLGKVSVSTTAQKFTVSGTLPSILGKTLGTQKDDNLRLFFNLPVGVTFDMDFAYVGVNAGDVALPYQARSFGEDLAICQRYFEKSYPYEVVPGTSLSGNNAVLFRAYDGYTPYSLVVSYKVAKRISPTVTLYATGTGNSNNITKTSDNSDVYARVINNDDKSFTLDNNSGTWTSNQQYSFQFTADARI